MSQAVPSVSAKARPFFPGILFCGVLGVFELARFQIQYKPLALALLTRNFRAAAMPLLMSVAAILGVIWLVGLLRRSSTGLRVAGCAVVSVCLIYEYSYQKTLQRFSTADDLIIAVFVTNAEHKVDASLAFVSGDAVLPIIVLALCVFGPKTTRSARGREWLVFCLLATTWAAVNWLGGRPTVAAWSSDMVPLLSLPNTLRSAVAFSLNETFAYHGPRDPVPLRPTTSPVQHIVFVVEEAVDAGHLSVNGYERETTPFLSDLARRGSLTNWGAAVSASTCSHSSGMFLYAGLRMKDLPDYADLALRRPNIFQWAKAAGYKTYFFDGQMTSFWIGPARDLQQIDQWQRANEFGVNGDRKEMVDIEIARRVRELLTHATERQFIFIWKAGMHYPYYRRFPAAQAPWKPFWEGRAIDSKHFPELINAYDDGIRWSTDEFFKALLGQGTEGFGDFRILYTSDHSQTLGRTTGTATHCGETSFEVAVPLFLIGQPGKLDESFHPSHENIFPTLLQFMGFDPPATSAVSLLKATGADNGERFFVGPNLAQEAPKRFDREGEVSRYH